MNEEDACCDDDPAVLDRIVQSGQKVYENAKFVLEENVGPALKFTDRGGGIALTPIKLHNLGDDGDEMDDDSLKSHLQRCKTIEYVQVDGQPGLMLHRGRCRFWTAIEVTPEVVRTKPDKLYVPN